MVTQRLPDDAFQRVIFNCRTQCLTYAGGSKNKTTLESWNQSFACVIIATKAQASTGKCLGETNITISTKSNKTHNDKSKVEHLTECLDTQTVPH